MANQIAFHFLLSSFNFGFSFLCLSCSLLSCLFSIVFHALLCVWCCGLGLLTLIRCCGGAIGCACWLMWVLCPLSVCVSVWGWKWGNLGWLYFLGMLGGGWVILVYCCSLFNILFVLYCLLI